MSAHLKYFIYMLVAGSIISCAADENSVKVKDWNILYMQEDSLETVTRETGWAPVSIPSTFILPYTTLNRFQFAWLRGEFEVESDPGLYYGLTAGRVRLADRIYINGRLIGSIDPGRVNWHPMPRNYIIQPGILKQGKNVIHIRLGVYGYDRCGISDDVLIQPEKEYHTALLINDFLFTQLPVGEVFLFTAFLLILIIAYVWDRREKQTLYAILLYLISDFYVFLVLPSNTIFSFEFFYGFKFITPFIITALLLMLYQSLYRVYLSDYNKYIFVLLAAIAVFIMMSTGTDIFPAVTRIMKYIYYIILIPLFVLVIYRLHLVNRLSTKNQDKFRLYMIIAISINFIIIIIFETYFYYAGGKYEGLIVIFSMPFVILFWAVFMPREASRRRSEMEALYNKLKRLERISLSDKNIVMTETAEEKMRRIVSFIDENYRSDISREDLAAAVDLNPNYMGTLFKSYTGKTINEYINSERIDEAVKKLKSADLKITDIAYSVGFDSLVTFNRLFKKAIGKTPSEFRENR